MKKTFYRVMTEFYDNGTVKACITSRETKVKPDSKHRETAIADCYEVWFDTMAEAESVLKEARAT